jgi:uncharacterized membrane protein YbhN (UPF0104 family)
MHWGFLPAIGLLALLHYVCSALVLQAAAGRRLPMREATLTQFTAAAANRVAPGGIGAAAVNARYLTCRGLSAPQALAAVAAAQTATFAGDTVLLCTVLTIGAGTGGGGGRMLRTLAEQIDDAVTAVPPSWLAAVALVVVALGSYVWRRRRGRLGTVLAATLTALAELRHRPGDLLRAVLASMAMSMTLSLAFALSVLSVPGASSPGALTTLLTAYFIGAAAGSAVPVPAGIGSTEAALVAVLGGAGISTGPALQAIVVFRAITYWAPVPIGILSARVLRRHPTLPAPGATAQGATAPGATVPLIVT